jgi:hypothetical protein
MSVTAPRDARDTMIGYLLVVADDTARKRVEAGIKRAPSEKSVADHELTARARNGALTVGCCNAAIFDDRERDPRGVFASARDVGEAKRGVVG